jgi:curli biogenesis system outer membrane secretion channel CsgG
MKPQRIGAALAGGLAVLALLACPTTGTGVSGAGALPEPAAGAFAGGTEAAGEPEPAASLPEALYQAYGELAKNIPSRASVAVISIASADPGEGEFALEELTLFLVNSRKYSVVDRRNLDLIRAEQDFQLSGEVDDDTAVSIGHLIGASIVITGSITPYDTVKYLRLKALDVKTGEIRAMASRRFTQ